MNLPATFTLLAHDEPDDEFRAKMMLFGRFVGSWDIVSTWYQPDGSTRSSKGEWHFAWILGGRGIQDVLFATGAPARQFGTTVRCYDTAMDAWHVSWMQPAGGEFVYLLGREVGDRIVQEGSGTDLARRERWTFSDITPNSFYWLGEVSHDDGSSWTVEQEMRGTRR
jgi:hypothetical protein